MAVRQFAIPLDDDSIQTGDITFKKLDSGSADVQFTISNVVAASTGNSLNLKTKKSGTVTNHNFTLTFSTGRALATVSASSLSTIFGDADGGDWDYVEAEWTLGATDTPVTSVMEMTQSGNVYDYTGWPPKQGA
ncbi:MAG: hypothetical protein H6508_00045 [Calditrichaeota bacterium]|nr:hypothetical protein [Calditrichota bacterium]MCB9365562.1 hypothetical protein [Calditrichota bacterium]